MQDVIAHSASAYVAAFRRRCIRVERAVMGSEYFCFDELPASLAQLHQHRDYLRQIITHRFGVDDIQAAFELFWKGETGKVIIEQ